MSAASLKALDALLQGNLTPEDLAMQAALLISGAVDMHWAALLTATPDAQTYQVVQHDPDLPTALLSYIHQRTRSLSPLARASLENLYPIFVDTYPKHPDAQQGGVLLGISAVAYLPLGHQAGQTYVMSVGRITTAPTRMRGTPWTEDERRFLTAAARKVQVALSRNTS